MNRRGNLPAGLKRIRKTRLSVLLVLGVLLSGSALAQTGPGNALSLQSNAAQYVTASIPTLSSNYTISAWVFLRAGGNWWGTRLCVLGGSNTVEVLVRSATSNNYDPQYLELARWGSFNGQPSSLPVPTNEWVHLAVVVSADKQISYFINGAAAGGWNGSGYDLSLGTTNILLGDNAIRGFDGMLDEVRIWNTARSQAEIQADMSRRLAGTEAGLLAYWRFDEAFGAVAINSAAATGWEYYGTLVNGPARVLSGIPFIPDPATRSASDIGRTSANLRASIHPGNLPTAAWFEWGETTNYGNASAASDLPATNTAIDAETVITGLTAGMTYYYRAAASNGAGIAYGDRQSFTCSLTPPVNVVTFPAIGISASNATLVGMVNPNGLPAAAWFEWGETTNYGNVTPVTDLPDYITEVDVSEALTNLSAYSLYHFRIVASNADGVVFGANESFFTPGLPGTNAPMGADKSFTVYVGQTLTITNTDWGFSDPLDLPPDNFAAVILTNLPAAGQLQVDGADATEGQVVAPAVTVPEGAKWTARATDQSWWTIASSADGTKLVAADIFGYLYTSSDAGTNWTARLNEEAWGWIAVASSADGTKLVAALNGGQLYTSADSGTNWTAREANRNWRSVASSADGTKLVAVAYGGQIYTSQDAGTNWTALGTNRNWIAIASSADGTKLIAAVEGGQLYTSTDAGTNWTAREDNRDWMTVASSADGTKLAAAGYDTQIYISSNAGTNWTARECNRQWRSVASSADGTKLAAAVYGGQIYTSARNPAPVVTYTAPYTLGTYTLGFQVQDDGVENTIDPTPNTLTFNVLKHSQTPLVFAPRQQAIGTTNALSVTGGSGTGAVSYAVLSGPGFLVDETNLAVTASSGVVVVAAAKDGDHMYYPTGFTTGFVVCVNAGEYAVLNTNDSGAGSLRDVLAIARTNPGPDTIVFAPYLAGQTITVTNLSTIELGGAAFTVDHDVTLDGASAPGLTISGNNQIRIFLVKPNGRLALKRLTLSKGRHKGGDGSDSSGWPNVYAMAGGGGGALGGGGAIWVEAGILEVIQCTLKDNYAIGGLGGRYIPNGMAGWYVNKTTLMDFPGGGGGMYSRGLDGCDCLSPKPSDPSSPYWDYDLIKTLGWGGGPNGGRHVDFYGGYGGGGPGADLTQGTAFFLPFASLGGFGGGGGCGGVSDPQTSVSACPGGFGGFGGGGGAGNGFTNIEFYEFGEYKGLRDYSRPGGSGGYGGGWGNDLANAHNSTNYLERWYRHGSGGGGAGMGGAIFNNGGSVTLTNSTLTGNFAIGNRGWRTEGYNSQLTGGKGMGGAIFNRNGSLTIVNCTISGNQTYYDGDLEYPTNGLNLSLIIPETIGLCWRWWKGDPSPAIETKTNFAGGQIYSLGDGKVWSGYPGPWNSTSTVTIVNSIISHTNSLLRDFDCDTIYAASNYYYTAYIGGTFYMNNLARGATNLIAGSGNLIRNASGFSGGAVSAADPLLGPPAFNAGPVETMLPALGSPLLKPGNPLIGAYGDIQPPTVYGLWRAVVFTPSERENPAISGDEADPDGDGMSNWQEFYAGTDPKDASSVLTLQNVRMAAGGSNGVVISWQSASDRSYVLQATTNLREWFAVELGTNLMATPPVNVHTDQFENTVQKFYRIQTQP